MNKSTKSKSLTSETKEHLVDDCSDDTQPEGGGNELVSRKSKGDTETPEANYETDSQKYL